MSIQYNCQPPISFHIECSDSEFHEHPIESMSDIDGIYVMVADKLYRARKILYNARAE